MPVGETSLGLRRAGAGDCELLFGWVNDRTVRRMSFSGSRIGWAEHVSWLEAKLRDPACLLYIVTGVAGDPIGQLRLDLEPTGEAIVSVSIAAEHRGSGYGAAAIRLAVEEAKRAGGIAVIHAYVKRENTASIRAFVSAGFDPPRRITYAGEAAFRMSLDLGCDANASAPE